ncbi:uL22 family ribosomal protein [Candidatus Berkelbacteria bacterium]|nr:uL22 family ribosomal protein [Candidatus Berkelbacteria bacterium]
MQVTVRANQVPISPRKLRFTIHALRGLTVAQAIAVMSVSPRQTVTPVVKLLQASVSAARDHAPAVTADQLKVATVFANEGTRLYRGRRRSKGRVARFAKRSSHLTLSVTLPSQSSAPAKSAQTTKPAKKPTSAKAKDGLPAGRQE